MAKQAGIICLTGKLGEITFYKQGNNFFAKKSKGPDRKQIMSGAGFKDTRKHITEFGKCSRSGKKIREEINKIFFHSDKNIYRRLLKLLWQVVRFDKSEK